MSPKSDLEGTKLGFGNQRPCPQKSLLRDATSATARGTLPKTKSPAQTLDPRHGRGTCLLKLGNLPKGYL